MLGMLPLPAQERTWSLAGVSMFSMLWWSPQCQLGLPPRAVPVPPVHQLSSPAFSHSWSSFPTPWLRMNCSWACSMPPVSMAQPHTVLMELYTNRSRWLSVTAPDQETEEKQRDLASPSANPTFTPHCLPCLSPLQTCPGQEWTSFWFTAKSPYYLILRDLPSAQCYANLQAKDTVIQISVCSLFTSHFFLLAKQLSEENRLISYNALYVFCRSQYYLPQPVVCGRDLLVLLWITTTVVV